MPLVESDSSKLSSLREKNSSTNNLITSEQLLLGSQKEVAPCPNRIIGTPDYMAPEILKGQDINSPSIDLWSLGVIFFEMVTGMPPFNDVSIEVIFEKIKNRMIPWDKLSVGSPF